MPLFGLMHAHRHSPGWKQMAHLPEVEPDDERTQKMSLTDCAGTEVCNKAGDPVKQ